MRTVLSGVSKMRQKERITNPFLARLWGTVNTQMWDSIVHTNGKLNRRPQTMTLESAINKAAQVWGIENMSFGERLRTVRTKQGLTAKDLAGRSGVPEK